jgi:hypothetical protein
MTNQVFHPKAPPNVTPAGQPKDSATIICASCKTRKPLWRFRTVVQHWGIGRCYACKDAERST